MRRTGLICRACVILLVVGVFLWLHLGPWGPPRRPPPDDTDPSPTPIVIVVTATAPTATPSPTDATEAILTTPTATSSGTLGATPAPTATVFPDRPVEEQINATPTSEGGIQRG